MSPAKHSGTYRSLCSASVCPSICVSVRLCVCLSVCLSGSHTFLVVTHTCRYMYVSQATHVPWNAATILLI